MSDRELLELAAKAAGMPTHTDGVGFVMAHHPSWNPLADDGDALRLAVELGMDVCIDTPNEDRPHTHAIGFSSPYASESFGVVENHESDPYAATRRAIVRAAAEIGRSMP